MESRAGAWRWATRSGKRLAGATLVRGGGSSALLASLLSCAGTPTGPAPRPEPIELEVPSEEDPQDARRSTAADLSAVEPSSPNLGEPGPPAPTHGAPAPVLTVVITSAGAMMLDGKVAGSDADAVLAGACGRGASAVIQADAAASYADVIGVMDRLQQAGCTDIAFGVSRQP